MLRSFPPQCRKKGTNALGGKPGQNVKKKGRTEKNGGTVIVGSDQKAKAADTSKERETHCSQKD